MTLLILGRACLCCLGSARNVAAPPRCPATVWGTAAVRLGRRRSVRRTSDCGERARSCYCTASCCVSHSRGPIAPGAEPPATGKVSWCALAGRASSPLAPETVAGPSRQEASIQGTAALARHAGRTRTSRGAGPGAWSRMITLLSKKSDFFDFENFRKM